MALRTGMTDLIKTLRGFTNTGYADYEIGGVPYWSDLQLQTVLDRYVVQIRDEEMTSSRMLASDNTWDYFDYQSKAKWYEATTGGSVRFIVKDYQGAVQGTALWSADYEKGQVTFVADTAGSVYYLTGFSYDVYAAAADVWYQKHAHASEQIDFSTDSHNIKRSHIIDATFRMAQRYEMLATTTVSSNPEMVRGDLNVI